MMVFQPINSPVAKRPHSQWRWSGKSAAFANAIRLNFSVSSLLLLGAFLQSIVILIIPRYYAILPTVLILAYRFADTLLITFKFKSNPYLAEANLFRTSPQIPDEDGNFTDEASNKGVVVFILGAKSNHPLGIFAPGFKEVGDYATEMWKELDRTAPDSGLYGATQFSSTDKNGANETLFLSYWRSIADIHNYAAGPLHRKAWDFWNRTASEHDHIGINHEIFYAGPKQWEGVYVNFQPTLLGGSTFLKKGDKMIGGTVDDTWVSPLIDATKGKLKTSAGRLGRDPRSLYEVYGNESASKMENY